MVKKKTARQKVREKTAKKELKDSTHNASVSDKNAGHIQPSVVDNANPRIQKKIAKKLRFIAKLQETASVLSARKTISKKRKTRRHDRGKKAIDLSSLAEFLPNLNGDSKDIRPGRVSKVLRNKARQKVVVHETKQLAAVLSHKAFQSNPFSAIEQHLVNTLPKPGVASTQAKNPNRKDRKAKKRLTTTLEERMDTA